MLTLGDMIIPHNFGLVFCCLRCPRILKSDGPNRPSIVFFGNLPALIGEAILMGLAPIETVLASMLWFSLFGTTLPLLISIFQFTKCLQPEILHILSRDTWFLQGYVIYTVRKKLKKQYIHLKGKQIEKLKNSGIEVCNFL